MTLTELSEGLDKWDHGLSVDAMNTIDDAIDRLTRTVALLKRIEWSAIVVAMDDEDQGEEMQACPECLARQRDGHAKSCELAALIGPV